MISSLPTIAEASRLMRSGELTPIDLVEYCLARIDQLENQVQAWVLVDAERAREVAQQQTKVLQEGGDLGSLTGIPIGIKDIVDVAGLPTKAGSPIRQGHVASRDAELVRRLRDQGAIILGKTVTTEFACFDPPPTRNPWDLQRTPGGSSSGSAAAVSLEMCMAAIGTQTGGSITRPASYCGVGGLKPTFGTVSVDGVVPISERLDHAGPIARSVADLVSVFCAIATPTMLLGCLDDALMIELQAGNLLELRNAPDIEQNIGAVAEQYIADKLGRQHAPRIVALDRSFAGTASQAVKSVTAEALRRVQDSFVAEREIRLPDSFSDVHTHHRRIMAVDATEYHQLDYARHAEQYGPHVSSLIEEGLAASALDYAAALRHQSQFSHDMDTVLRENSIAAMPATTTTAPARESTGDPRFNSPWSYSGLPTITVPCGIADDGLPCGLQLIGPKFSELRLLKAAAWCEERIGFDDEPSLMKGNSP